MRILRVITSMDPQNGGPSEGIRQINRVLDVEGHETEVACLDPPDAPWVGKSPESIHTLGPPIGKYSYSKKFIPWLRANSGRFDCAIIHGVWQYASLGTWLALRRGDTPYFVYPHGMLDPWFRRAYPLKHLKKSIYWRLVERKVLRDARAVLFTCDEERLLASQSFRPYQCRDVTVNYGTSGPVGDPDAQRRSFLDRFPDLADKRLLLYLGRIHPKKGIDLLIEAFTRVTPDASVLHLVIAGPDEIGWKARLEQRAHELGIGSRITWTGMLSGDLKWGAFHSADAFVLPSHQENFGLAVTEALACGLPVLISNKVNIWREIQADDAGFVGDDDLRGTTEGLRSWLSLAPPQQQTLRQRARQCFNCRFHIRRAAESLIQILRDHGVER